MNAYIYDAVRTPRGRGKKDGSLHEVTPVRLSVGLLKALQKRNNLDTSLVEDIVLGCVTQIGEQGGEIAKTVSMAAGYDEKVSGVTINRFCGSGLEAINQAAAYLSSGQVQLLMAGGVESMSRVAMGSDGGAWYMDPSVSLPTYFVPQGIAADLLATKYGYTRQDVDQFAVNSHKKAAEARAKGYFNKSIVPVLDINGSVLLQQDETIRPETSMEALAKLDPSFVQYGQMAGFDSVAIQKYPELEQINHVHHAGNSSGIVDGAAMVLMGTEEIGKSLGLKPRAKIRSFAVIGTEPTIMLTGPIPATELALKRAGLQISDIDLFEVNEAFAAVVLRYMDALQVPEDKVNVNGGAIAMGHPLGATGAILLNTVLDELERRDKQFGLISLCIGGGMGIATIIERV
jgi:acetyl-CoA C-acetyltransferase